MNKRLLSMALAGTVGFAEAAVVAKPVAYEIDGEAFEGTLVYDDAVTTPRPGLVMVPNWLGVTDRAAEKAARAASDKYVVFVADLYGKAVRPSNADEAKAAASSVRADRPLMRKRTQAAVDALKSQAGSVALDSRKLAAIGFCFGGGAVLELARSRAPTCPPSSPSMATSTHPTPPMRRTSRHRCWCCTAPMTRACRSSRSMASLPR